MKRARVNGIELEYQTRGSGEPLLLISPVVADGFQPFVSAPTLVDRYRLIHYHRRGWCGSTRTTPPVSVRDHAADAAALLEHLGVARSHVAGHSSGGAIAMQLAFERPDLVHTLILLEPSVFSVPSAPNLFERAAPALDSWRCGDHEGAVASFLSLVSGLKWETCQAVMNENVPGGVAQATRDADTFFGVELPALGTWEFAAEHAATITQPVLSVLGSDTERLWVEVAEVLRSWIPQVDEVVINGLGHLLHMQSPQPVVRGVAAFLDRHPMVAPLTTQPAASPARPQTRASGPR
jgi:pimeloyl-ACP methyl ester carboxylesterase